VKASQLYRKHNGENNVTSFSVQIKRQSNSFANKRNGR